MSGYNECDPCKHKDQEPRCECEEDPSVRSLRRQLCRLEGTTVVILTDNFFGIVCGTVERVTNGTVVLTGGTVFGVPVPRTIVALTKINVVIPLPAGTTCRDLVGSMIAGISTAGTPVV